MKGRSLVRAAVTDPRCTDTSEQILPRPVLKVVVGCNDIECQLEMHLNGMTLTE
jgi:hypothetical protein